MFNQIDLRALAERRGPECAFLSLYLSGPDAMRAVDARRSTTPAAATRSCTNTPRTWRMCLPRWRSRRPSTAFFLIGSSEAMHEIEAVMPTQVASRLAGKQTIDLSQGKDEPWRQALGLFTEKEREAEEALWERIKGEYLRGGRAVAGPVDVLEAAAVGRVEKMIVTRDAKIAGLRCRSCENLSAGDEDVCPVCGSDDVFTEDLINELVELLALSSAETEFSDAIEGLTEARDVAALLRY